MYFFLTETKALNTFWKVSGVFDLSVFVWVDIGTFDVLDVLREFFGDIGAFYPIILKVLTWVFERWSALSITNSLVLIGWKVGGSL
jgi:hypothetical protein